WRSTDSGRSWTEIDAGLPGGPASLGVDPSDSDTAFVGIQYTSSVYKTTDGGASWAPVGPGLAGTIEALSFAPSRPGTVFAGSGYGVFRSTDGGASWTPFNRGLLNPRVASLAVDPAGAALHAGTISNGVFDIPLG
ncbi:MAG: hypothetical protein E6G40_06730, partial [Actinobacteria bacterium]